MNSGHVVGHVADMAEGAVSFSRILTLNLTIYINNCSLIREGLAIFMIYILH